MGRKWFWVTRIVKQLTVVIVSFLVLWLQWIENISVIAAERLSTSSEYPIETFVEKIGDGSCFWKCDPRSRRILKLMAFYKKATYQLSGERKNKIVICIEWVKTHLYWLFETIEWKHLWSEVFLEYISFSKVFWSFCPIWKSLAN